MQKIHILDNLEKRNEFIRNPYFYYKALNNWSRPMILSHQQRIDNKFASH